MLIQGFLSRHDLVQSSMDWSKYHIRKFMDLRRSTLLEKECKELVQKNQFELTRVLHLDACIVSCPEIRLIF